MTLIPIMIALEEEFSFEQTEQIGLVFPLHYQSMPIPVKTFIEKYNFAGAKFLSMTYWSKAPTERNLIDCNEVLVKIFLLIERSVVD